MRRAFSLTLIVWLCSGCFVLDEIDKGAAIMDQHASQERREAEAKEKAEDDDGGSLLANLQGQVAGLGGWLQKATEKAPAERDPSDTVTRCQLAGRTKYLRKSDCRVRGGTVL
jgi:hypothetical protein